MITSYDKYHEGNKMLRIKTKLAQSVEKGTNFRESTELSLHDVQFKLGPEK